MTRFSTRARRGAVALVVALVAPIGVVAATAAPSAAALPACTKTWTNTAGGSWDTAASWSGGTLPTDEDHVCITTAGTYTVTLADPGDPVSVASLRVGTASGATTQTLVVSRGVDTDVEDSLYADEGIDVSPRGVIELGESATAGVSLGAGCGCEGVGITNAGTIRQATGSTEVQTIWADIVNTGLLQLDQALYIEGSLTNDGNGVLQVNHVLHVMDTMWTKGGSVRGDWLVAVYGELRVGAGDTDVESGAPGFTVEDGGLLTFQSDSPIDVTTRGAVLLTGDTHEDQDIKVQSIEGADAALVFAGTWTNDGHLTLEPGTEEGDALLVGFQPGSTVVNEGALERFGPDGADAVVIADLVNRGSIETSDGLLEVIGDLSSEATIELGYGEIYVDEDLDLGLGNVIHHALRAGGDPAAGLLTVDGTAAIRGLLINHTDIAPAVGATTTVVDATTRTGTFADILFWGPASYDAEYTDTQVNLVRRASESLTRRFVRAAFQDFLDRQPTPTELDQKATAIDGGTLTRASFVRQLSLSEEYVTALVQRFYADTLGRPGDPDGVAFWVDRLRTGTNTVAEVAGSFYASPEYFNRAGGTNQAWITDLYGVFFHRAPTGGDLTYWTTRIAQRGRTRVAIELFQSLESRRQRVDRLYQDLLGRDGDAAGVDYWAARITTEGDLGLAVFLAASAEYRDRAEDRYP